MALVRPLDTAWVSDSDPPRHRMKQWANVDLDDDAVARLDLDRCSKRVEVAPPLHSTLIGRVVGESDTFAEISLEPTHQPIA